ncbi:MAG: hypothetical protein ABIB71_05730 [Candidatus Woesearchaeota archaeon]
MPLTEFLYRMDDKDKEKIETEVDEWIEKEGIGIMGLSDKYFKATRFGPYKEGEKSLYLRLRLIEETEKEGGYMNLGTSFRECYSLIEEDNMGFWLKNELKKKRKAIYEKAEKEHPVLCTLLNHTFIGWICGFIPIKEDLEKEYEEFLD